MPTSSRRRKLALAARDRRADLGRKRKCLNGAHHGKATHGRRCEWCAFVNSRGLTTAVALEAEGKAPPRPPKYKPRPRGEPRGTEPIDSDDDEWLR